ncbi:pilin, partial [Moraxella sp. K1664]
LPAYQDYISKSQTTRVVGELAAGKTAIDAALFEGKEPILKGDSTTTKENIGLTTGPNSDNARSNLLASGAGGLTLNVNANTVTLTGTLGRNANNDIKGATVAQTRDANGNWSCTVAAGSAPGWKDKFAPAGCTVGAATSSP